MKHVYVDASVLLRVVLDEPNQISEWDAFEEPVMSTLVEVEGLRAIDRAMRRGTHPRRKPLSDTQANEARVRLHQALEMFTRIELEPSIVSRAGQLAGPLGTLDALHLATALTWKERAGVTLTLATHDPELGLAALTHGLSVVGL
ncbi:MAG: type II toxin-antitoxin system VapC family toxin [Myxococcaceae bacterium]